MPEVSRLYYSSTGTHGSRAELVIVLGFSFLALAAILGACFGVWLVLG